MEHVVVVFGTLVSLGIVGTLLYMTRLAFES